MFDAAPIAVDGAATGRRSCRFLADCRARSASSLVARSSPLYRLAISERSIDGDRRRRPPAATRDGCSAE